MDELWAQFDTRCHLSTFEIYAQAIDVFHQCLGMWDSYLMTVEEINVNSRMDFAILEDVPKALVVIESKINQFRSFQYLKWQLSIIICIIPLLNVIIRMLSRAFMTDFLNMLQNLMSSTRKHLCLYS